NNNDFEECRNASSADQMRTRFVSKSAAILRRQERKRERKEEIDASEKDTAGRARRPILARQNYDIAGIADGEVLVTWLFGRDSCSADRKRRCWTKLTQTVAMMRTQGITGESQKKWFAKRRSASQPRTMARLPKIADKRSKDFHVTEKAKIP